MKANKYLVESGRTDLPDYTPVIGRVLSNDKLKLLHGVLGVESEAGELTDQLKKHLFYGKPLDVVNIEEELGDLFWYIALLCRTLGLNFSSIQRKNIEKLRVRYPEKFTEHDAVNRKLDEERTVLEK